MIEDLWANLTYRMVLTVFFLILWPVGGAVVAHLWGRSKDGPRLRLCEALHYSLATYAGLSGQESNPARFKWLKLIHRLVGILAWAYITAVFIATIK